MNIYAYLDKECIVFLKEDNNSFRFFDDNLSFQYLHFFFNSSVGKFNNNIIYKIFALETKENFFSDIFDNLFKNKEIAINNHVYQYSFFIQFIIQKIISASQNIESFNLIFSDYFNLQQKDLISNIFKNFNQNTFIIENLAEIATKFHINKHQIFTPTNFLFINALTENIQAIPTVYDANEIIVKKEQTKNIKIQNPLTYSLTNKILQFIYSSYKIAITDEQKDKNFSHLFAKLYDKTNQIVNFHKEFAVINTKLTNSNERYYVKINPKEIISVSQVEAKNMVSQLNSFNNSNVVLVIGNNLDDKLLTQHLKEHFSKVIMLNLNDVLQSKDAPIAKIDEFSTMFLAANDNTNQDEPTSQILDNLQINSLEIGQNIVLNTFDAAEGKGAAREHFENVGENKFVVIDSTRSLKPGDLVETTESNWKSGIKLILTVFRGGKVYGKYQTREIQSIEILS